MLRIRLWQWPNLLALDAALIALIWQAAFAAALGYELSSNARVVLGLSVWLTYMADRLFDVASRPIEQLHALRHRFAKQHTRRLWKLWSGTLLLNIGIALAGLTRSELYSGFILLTLCLLYTALNQKFSKHFFPKEICVALIYTGGVVVFLPQDPSLWLPAIALALLCLINCLMIGTKEHAIDAAMQVRSMTRFPKQLIFILKVLCAGSLYWLEHEWALPIGLSLGTLCVVHAYHQRLSTETYRVLTDSLLLVGPSIALCVLP